jgi:hypothetical protein
LEPEALMARQLVSGLVSLALLAACGGEAVVQSEPVEEMSPAEAADAERTALARCGEVTVSGYCGVNFGMTVAEARQAFPVSLESYASAAGGAAPDAGCHELFAAEPVTGVSFVVEGGRIGRVDLMTEAARTADGFGVGTQASAIRTRFGDAMGMATNALEPEITDLTVAEGDTKFVFEIQDGVVRAWRAGIAPTIDYVAYCG